jgi:hypothetical protein
MAVAGRERKDPEKGCDFSFPTGKLPGPNPNNLVSVKVSGNPTTGVGVYVKKHFGKIKVGSAGGTTTFRIRYVLSDPEGGCNIWYEIAQTKHGPPEGVDDSDYKWSDRRQRRFDEEYVDRLIPAGKRYRSESGDDPVTEVKWKKYRHIFGYGKVPEDFGK